MLIVLSDFAVILVGTGGLDLLLCWCHVAVDFLLLLLRAPWVVLQDVIVVISDHAHL